MEGIITVIVYALGLIGFVVAVKQLVYIFSDVDNSDNIDKIARENVERKVAEMRSRMNEESRVDAAESFSESVSDLSEKDIIDEDVRNSVASLRKTDTKISEYLKDHPERAKLVKRYTNFYRGSAVSFVKKYVELQNTVTDKKDFEPVVSKAKEVLGLLEREFQEQHRALYNSVVFDLKIDGETIKKASNAGILA